ncbi:MAG: TonB-dependent receptor [Gammaproteobacteria bacterium]|nr:TonB-dependent receptor [Gammaproteobacteria bacterium]
MKRSLFCLGGGLFACLSSSVIAAAEQAPPVIVSATRTAQIADEALAPVIVITREEIERSQATDVADLLRFHAGMDIGRNGGPGQPTSLFLRGTDSNHTLVLIDGVRMNPGTIGGAAINNLNPALIERIEVVKGPRSTLYGSDAIGGVINIITRGAPQGARLEATVGTGSFGTRELGGAATYRDGDRRIGLEIAGQDTDGYAPRSDSDLESGYDNTSVKAFAGARLGAVDAELSHFQAGGKVEYLDFFLTPIDQDYENAVTALDLRAEPAAGWASHLQLSRAIDEIDQNQSADYAHTERLTLDWQNDVQLGEAQLLTAGLQLSREDVAALSFGTLFDESTDVNALYLQDAIEHGAHRWLLAARHTDHETFGGNTTWDLEYGYQLSDATRLTAAAGTAFRAPDGTDRFGFGGNPDLDPEEARNLELGLHHTLTPRQIVTLSAFQNDIDDLIEFDFGTSQMINVGEARIRGVEAGYRFTGEHWRARVEAIAQDPENTLTGDPLPRRARHSLTSSASYDIGRYRLGADLLLTGERKDSDFTDTVMGGYGLMNLTAAVRLGAQWTLRGRVENLFDKEYVIADGYNTAERSYLLQLSWRSTE